MESKGEMLGIDMDDVAIMPISSARICSTPTV